jgi:TrmH family RNA methyltransferase
VLASISILAHPPRQLAVFRRADLQGLHVSRTRNLPDTGLMLWRVGDPGNLGAIVRAADGLGPAVVALSAGCADPTGPKALRASMGAVFRVPLCPFEDAPGRRIALVAHGGEPLHELDLGGPVSFVLGSEREGLPESVAAACDARGSIGLEPGAESLNVALAAALALYERRRAKAGAGDGGARG